jgi:hypothetical protein
MLFGPIFWATRERREANSANRSPSSKTGAGGATRIAGAGDLSLSAPDEADVEKVAAARREMRTTMAND